MVGPQGDLEAPLTLIVGAMRDGGRPPRNRPFFQDYENLRPNLKEKLIFWGRCSAEQMQASRVQNALRHSGEALRETEAALEEVRAESDPLGRAYLCIPPAISETGHEER
jgi:hypothetical protein